MFDKVWKSLMLGVLAVGVGVFALQSRYEVVRLNDEYTLEYDHWTRRAGLLLIAEVWHLDHTPKDLGGAVVVRLDARRGTVDKPAN